MSSRTTAIVPTILCGGVGTRLWPLSRDEYPKQLLSLTGRETMLQATLARMRGFKHTDVHVAPNPIVVCNEDHRFLIAEQLKSTGYEGADILLEPVGRNTAPALTLAALQASQQGQDPLLLVMPADHVIEDITAFHRAIASGVQAALGGAIVTFGIIPDRPETGYGYIQADQCCAAVDQILPISRFVEKPDRAMAQAYLRTGGYYWNSGIFLLKAGIWLKAMRQLQPEIFAACRAALEKGNHDNDFIRLDRDIFTHCPADSIDYAVMEKLVQFFDPPIQGIVVPLSAGWSDWGAWDAVWKMGEKDAHGNSIQGDVFLEGTSQTLVYSTSRLVACVGVKGLGVVETSDAVLVADMAQVEDVKQIVTALKTLGRREATGHRKVYRPWGWYDSIGQGDGFQVKRIVVNPGGILSLQLHRHRSEHWVVIQGEAKITLGEKIIQLYANQSIYIPVEEKHRLENLCQTPLELIEVQVGDYLGEDDIERFEDSYGRVGIK